MWNFVGFVTLIIYANIYVQPTDADCPVNWKEYNGSCYFFTTQRYVYNDASDVCSTRNATMYAFHSVQQQDWVASQIEHMDRIEYWIGLLRVNRTWTWIDNTTYDSKSTKWFNNQTGTLDDARHRCATMYSYKPYTGQVHQQDCLQGWGTICVRPNDAYQLCNSDDGWQLLANKCYKFFNVKSNWFDANMTCTKNGATLLRPVTRNEIMAEADIMTCGTAENQIWIDVSDVPYPGQFRYSNNNTVQYQWWNGYQNVILTKGGTCVYSNPLSYYYWDTELCTVEKKFMCSKPTGTCPPGWAQHIDKCYQLVSVPALKDTWFGAKAFCENQNSGLLTITSDDEESFIQSIMVSQQVQLVWLGLSDTAQPDVLAWPDGTVLNGTQYSHWDITFPNLTFNRTDCGKLQAGRVTSAWSNGYCFVSLPFICKATITSDIKTKPTVAPSVHCDPGWVLNKGDCYYFGVSQNSSGYSWSDARRFCFAANADLTTIRTPLEQAFIMSNVLSISTSWFGLHYSPVYQRLIWVDQTYPTFLNFYPGEPDDLGSGEDCMQIVGGRQDFTGAWDDGNCSIQQDFICRKHALPGASTLVTKPPSTLGPFSYQCGPEWIFNSLDGFCYQVVLYQPKTFADSQWACQQMGSNLASITGPREQRYLQAILNTGTYLKVASNFWIGGSDASQEGGWTWIDGSPFAYLNWHPGEPNESQQSPLGEDCIEIVPNWNYQWNDKRCDQEQSYICKKPALPMTTTVLTPTSGPIYTCGNEPMISGNFSLLDGDTALTASSSRDSTHGPFNSRLYRTNGFGLYAPTPGWSSGLNARGDFIQAYFYNTVTFKGIITAGNPSASEWVITYQLQYQYDFYSEMVNYEEPPGTTKIFAANTDSNSPVTNVIQFPFQAKYIRLYPLTWHNAITLRWEVLGCVEEFCLADYAISGPLVAADSDLTASSFIDQQHAPSAARLHSLSPQTPLSAWKPVPIDNRNSYIQVDLGSMQIIRGISVAGNPNAQEWVASFRVSYGLQANLVTSYYQEPYQTIKIFDGNTNNNETVTYYFKGHFSARFIKIEPVSYHSAIAMRFDVMVCPHGCNQRRLLGGATGVKDNQLSASSYNDNRFGPSQSRLNQPAVGDTGGAWQPMYNDQRQWIQVDLQAMIQITAVATQGREGHDEWVTQYQLAYSSDGSNFIMYSGFQINAMVFLGNFDDSTQRKQYLTLPIVARFVRLYPLNYYKRISLRWEVFGCPGPDSGTMIGCYADDALSRDLSYEPYGDPSVGMWPPMCIHHCFSRGYYYAGLQNRYMCFCGNSYGRYGSSNSCDQSCYTRPNFKCGGLTSNSVYTTGLTPVTKVCPPNWKAYNDNCFLLLLNQTSWFNARQDCHIMGGELATVNSRAEQDLVYSVMSTNGGSDVWIGLNDNQEQNFFEWINGEVTKFTNWNVNQPSNTNSQNENCVMINRTDGGWQDENCDEAHQYLCMTAKKGSTQPTTPPVSPGCDIGWTGFRWSCYLFVDQTRTFLQASLACKARGATLVQIDDRFEQAFLSSTISKKSGMYWTDATALTIPGTYINIDTMREVTYTNWAPGRPGSGRSCVAMQTVTPAGFWIDSNCTMLAGAVCEMLAQGQTMPTPPSTTPAPIPCPKGWIDVSNFCYQVNIVSTGHQMPYNDANKDCQVQGAFLASFHNSSDFGYLWRNYLVGANADFWIGINALTLSNQQRRYTWTDSTPVNYVNWAPNQPDNYQGKEDCGEVWAGNGLWNDQICSYRRNWICKVPKGANVRSRFINNAPTAGPPGNCVGLLNWSFYNNHCYIVVDGSGNQAKTWREARTWCQVYNADLVSIGSMFEQLFVQAQAANISGTTLWTGFSEIDFEYGYRWSDGTVPAYVNWGTGEPNDFAGAEDCVEMTVYNGKWNDAHCAEKKGFVCEQAVGSPPLTTPAPLINGFCPAGFTARRNKCYKVFSDLKTWSDANIACQALGGGMKGYYLASISDMFENAFVTTLLSGLTTTPWIGLKQRFDNQFQWVDNTEVTYTNWNEGEPNGARGVTSCGRIYSTTHNAGRWDDVPCDVKLGYVCATNKKTTITTPEAIPNPCPSGYLYYNSDCFLYIPTKSTWSAADTDCKTRNSHLATIANPFEQSFMFLMLNDPSMVSNSSVWIGLNDVQNTGSYKWTEPAWSVAYTNWDSGQPQRAAGGGCVSASINGHWSDTSCNQLLPYICKTTTAIPPATPPGPNGQCRNNWISYGSKCYRFNYNTKLNYLDATLDCNRQRSSVVSVHSMDENQFLLNTMKSFTIQSEGFWLGFHKSPISGFEWYDKSTAQFINWGIGQPSGKSQRGNEENCVEVQSWNGAWNDEDCTSLRGYICERPQDVDVVDNTTPGPLTQTVSPTKMATSVPQTITPPLPTQSTLITPSLPAGTTPAAVTTMRPSVATNSPMPTIPGIPNYTGNPQTGNQEATGKDLSTGALIGFVIAVIIVLALPTVGIILWKRNRTKQTRAMNFENSTYQYDSKHENGQFVDEHRNEQTET